MKTTIQAVVMLCAAFGNVIVMIAAKADLLEQVDIREDQGGEHQTRFRQSVSA